MKTKVWVAVAIMLFASIASSEEVKPLLPEWACKEYIEPVNAVDMYEIVGGVFYDKIVGLQSQGVLPKSFLSSSDSQLAICRNNRYGITVLYGETPTVVFDFQLIGFLYAQARSLILGQYIAEHLGNVSVTKLHELVIAKVTEQGDTLERGLSLVSSTAKEIGVGDSFLREALADDRYIERERTLFLQALYFLSLHERCHLFLDHGSQEADSVLTVDKELEADRCAIGIINSDETRYKSSPISILGVLLTISSQAVLEYALPDYFQSGQHPPSRARFSNAVRLVEKFISQQRKSASDRRYAETVRGLADYFTSLVEHLNSP